MFENIAAIDIGSSSVKLLIVRTGFKNFKVTSMSYEDVEPGDSSGGAVEAALGRLLGESDLSGCVVLSNLPMEKTVIRNISFPFDDVHKIASALPYEAEENLPFRMDDLVMDFQTLKSPNPGEGRIMLAAATKDSVRDFTGVMQSQRLAPLRLGLESNALFECYKYFNQIPEEAVIQIDIGNNKTIVNIVQNSQLLYTRCIPIGIGAVHRDIAAKAKIPPAEARRLFESLNMDLTSLENNYQREIFKSLNINRARLKQIYDKTLGVVEEIIEQVALTIRSFAVEFGNLGFNRALISGGGSNIAGIGFLISRELELPVVSLPFLQDYSERKIQTQFPIVFGTVLSYLDGGRSSANLLKGEFLPDIAGTSRKIYYLAGGFAALSLVILIVSLTAWSVVRIRSNARGNELLNERLSKYFHTRQESSDPVKTATEIVAREKKELGGMDLLVQSNQRVIDLLRDILQRFPKGIGFQLNNLVINENVVRIDGSVSSSREIDEFKNKLNETGMFESVDLNTNITKKNETSFSMVIKQKMSGERRRSAGAATEP